MDKNSEAVRVKMVCDQLRRAGHRVTPQRLAIIEFVFGSTEHPTVRQIYDALQDRFPTMSLMTVYETVRLLARLGHVRVASTHSEHTHYDGARPEPHAHLVCQSCGCVVDADWRHDGQEVPQPEEQGWEVQSWHLEWLGLCPDCLDPATGVSKHKERG